MILRYLIFPHVFWHWYRLLDRLFPGAAVKNVVSGDVGDHFDDASSGPDIMVMMYSCLRDDRAGDDHENSRD